VTERVQACGAYRGRIEGDPKPEPRGKPNDWKAPPCSCCAWRKRPATVTVTMRSAAHTFRTPCTYSAISNSPPRRCRMRSIPRMSRDVRRDGGLVPLTRRAVPWVRRAQAFRGSPVSELCGRNFATMSSCGATSAQLLEKVFRIRPRYRSFSDAPEGQFACLRRRAFLLRWRANAPDGQGDHAHLTLRGSSGMGSYPPGFNRSVMPRGKSAIHS
jgi:hypothetical protein